MSALRPAALIGAAALALVLLLGPGGLWAEDAPAAASPAASPAAGTAAASGVAADDALPRLDQDEPENPFSRFEIVSLGSYPISIFYVNIAFDLQAWIASGYDSAYTPIFSATTANLTDTQRLQRLGVALGVSAVIGIIDAVIHQSKLKAAKRLREARLSAGDAGSGPPGAPADPKSP